MSKDFIKQAECEFFYRLSRTIGQGTFATVKVATHRETNATVAIKILKKDALITSSHDHIIEEVEILQKLHHPNIVPLYEVIEGRSNICFVMELMNGGELFDRILERERYSEVEAKEVIRQVVSAVQYLHSFDIVHR
jgi:serine/threonine protein kinase